MLTSLQVQQLFAQQQQHFQSADAYAKGLTPEEVGASPGIGDLLNTPSGLPPAYSATGYGEAGMALMGTGASAAHAAAWALPFAGMVAPSLNFLDPFAGAWWMGKRSMSAAMPGFAAAEMASAGGGLRGLRAGFSAMQARGMPIAPVVGRGLLGAAVGFAPYYAAGAAFNFGVEQLLAGGQQTMAVGQMLDQAQMSGLTPGFMGGAGFRPPDALALTNSMRDQVIAMNQRAVGTMGLGGILTGGQNVMGMGQATELLGMGLQAGFFKSSQNIQDFQNRFRELLQTTRTVASALNQSLGEAMQTMAAVRGQGFTGIGQAGGAAVLSAGLAVAGGMQAQEMLQVGSYGSQISRTFGGTGTLGSMALQRTAALIGGALRTGSMSEAQLMDAAGMGGSQGIASLATRWQYHAHQLVGTRQGQRLVAALTDPVSGGIDPGLAAQFESGQLSSEEIRALERQHRRQPGFRQMLRAHRTSLSAELVSRVGPVGLMSQLAETEMERRGTSSFEGEDVIMQQITHLGESDAQLVRQLGARLSGERGSVMQHWRRALDQNLTASSGKLELSWANVKKALYARYVEPIAGEIQKYGAQLHQNASDWLTNIIQEQTGMRPTFVSPTFDRALRTAMSGDIETAQNIWGGDFAPGPGGLASMLGGAGPATAFATAGSEISPVMGGALAVGAAFRPLSVGGASIWGAGGPIGGLGRALWRGGGGVFAGMEEARAMGGVARFAGAIGRPVTAAVGTGFRVGGGALRLVGGVGRLLSRLSGPAYAIGMALEMPDIAAAGMAPYSWRGQGGLSPEAVASLRPLQQLTRFGTQARDRGYPVNWGAGRGGDWGAVGADLSRGSYAVLDATLGGLLPDWTGAPSGALPSGDYVPGTNQIDWMAVPGLEEAVGSGYYSNWFTRALESLSGQQYGYARGGMMHTRRTEVFGAIDAARSAFVNPREALASSLQLSRDEVSSLVQSARGAEGRRAYWRAAAASTGDDISQRMAGAKALLEHVAGGRLAGMDQSPEGRNRLRQAALSIASLGVTGGGITGDELAAMSGAFGAPASSAEAIQEGYRRAGHGLAMLESGAFAGPQVRDLLGSTFFTNLGGHSADEWEGLYVSAGLSKVDVNAGLGAQIGDYLQSVFNGKQDPRVSDALNRVMREKSRKGGVSRGAIENLKQAVSGLEGLGGRGAFGSLLTGLLAKTGPEFDWFINLLAGTAGVDRAEQWRNAQSRLADIAGAQEAYESRRPGYARAIELVGGIKGAEYHRQYVKAVATGDPAAMRRAVEQFVHAGGDVDLSPEQLAVLSRYAGEAAAPEDVIAKLRYIDYKDEFTGKALSGGRSGRRAAWGAMGDLSETLAFASLRQDFKGKDLRRLKEVDAPLLAQRIADALREQVATDAQGAYPADLESSAAVLARQATGQRVDEKQAEMARMFLSTHNLGPEVSGERMGGAGALGAFTKSLEQLLPKLNAIVEKAAGAAGSGKETEPSFAADPLDTIAAFFGIK